MSASQFDQRYDSIYQRGGDARGAPRAGARPAASGPAFRTAATERATDGSPEHATGIAEVIPPDAAPQVRPEGTPAVRGKVNPFLVALWVLGLGLAVFGAWGSVAPYFIEVQAADPFNAQPFGPPWSFVLSTFAPNLLVAGLIIIAGVLTLHAVNWSRRRG